jgi:hypothetical protein
MSTFPLLYFYDFSSLETTKRKYVECFSKDFQNDVYLMEGSLSLIRHRIKKAFNNFLTIGAAENETRRSQCKMLWSTCKGTFAAGVYLSEAQNLIPSPTHCIRVYSILTCIHTGKGGRVEPEKRLAGATVHKAGSKIPT